jgi:hypothetical protein
VLSLGQVELLQFAATGAWNIDMDYPGTDSPDGCGANSNYAVTYSVEATSALVAVPNIVRKSPGAAKGIAAAAGLVYSETDARIGAPRSAPIVVGQTPPAGKRVMSGSGLEAAVELPTPKGHPQP